MLKVSNGICIVSCNSNQYYPRNTGGWEKISPYPNLDHQRTLASSLQRSDHPTMMSGGARGFSERPGRRGGGDRTVARGWKLREGVGGWRGPCARQMADPSIHRDKPTIVVLKLATPVFKNNRRSRLHNHNTISCDSFNVYPLITSMVKRV